MIVAIKIKDYSILSKRHEKKALNQQLKAGWADAARYFHDKLRDRRFTQAHATKAGFAPRRKKYISKKYKKFGHTRPMEFTGTARRAVAGFVRITSTSKGSRAAYPGARVFNLKNPNSDPKMNLNVEFRTILPEEAELLADVIEARVEDLVYQWHTGNNDPEVIELLQSSGLAY